MKVVKTIAILLISIAMLTTVGVGGFLLTIYFTTEKAGSDNELALSSLQSEFEVDLGTLYSISGIVETVYVGEGIKNDETVEMSYVILDNGILCRFYEVIHNDISNVTIKVKGRAEYSGGGLVILDNCTIMEEK